MPAPRVGEVQGAPIDASAAYLASIVEFSTDAISSIDLDGRISSWNRTAENLFGYGRAEILRQPYDILIPPDRRAEDAFLMDRLRAGEVVAHFETQRLTKDSALVDVSITASAIRDGQGALVGFSEILHDIRAQKEAQREMQRLQLEMIRLSRWNMMGMMSSSLAHELNQPLTAALSFVRAAWHLLPPEAEQAREYLDLAVDEIKLAGGILHSLRQFIEKRELSRTPHDINQLLTEALRLSLFAGIQVRHRIETDLTQDMPDVPMDGVQVQQVILNLLRNAIEATMAVPSPHIVLTTRVQPDDILVTVRDNGPGLSTAPETLFEPFNTTKAEGMGVGLSVCRLIIEAHGGRIWAGAGPGAVFSFTLPRRPS